MRRLLFAGATIVTLATGAWAISDLARYKTFGREVLTAAHLNEMQDAYVGKINELITTVADSNYVRMNADTLTAAHSVTVGAIEVSKITHTHVDSHYIKADVDSVLVGGVSADSTWAISTFAHPATGYAVFSHGHTAAQIGADNKTGSGKFVFHTSPALAGTPTVGSGLIWHKENDGASSELDADLLDGQEGAYYGAEGGTGEVQVKDSDGTFEGDPLLVFSSGKLKIGGTPSGPAELQVASTGQADAYLISAASEDIVLAMYEAGDARALFGVDASTADDLIFINSDGAAANGVQISQTGKVGIEAAPHASSDLTLGAGGLRFSNGSTQTVAADVLNGQTSAGSAFAPQFILGGTAQPSIYFKSNNSSSEFWEIAQDAANGIAFVHGSSRVLMVDNDGVSINATSVPSGIEFYVDGDINASGNVTGGSDDRFKGAKVNLTNVLDKIRDLDTFEYSWNDDVPRGVIFEDDGTTRRRYIGVSAQQLEVEYPALASENDGMYGVQYNRLVPVLLAAIQELEARVAVLEAE